MDAIPRKVLLMIMLQAEESDAEVSPWNSTPITYHVLVNKINNHQQEPHCRRSAQAHGCVGLTKTLPWQNS